MTLFERCSCPSLNPVQSGTGPSCSHETWTGPDPYQDLFHKWTHFVPGNRLTRAGSKRSRVNARPIWSQSGTDPKFIQSRVNKALGSIYTRPDPFGTGTKLVRIRFVFTRDLVDPVRIRSAIWYQLDPLMKVILCGTIPFHFRTGPVQTEWSDPQRI